MSDINSQPLLALIKERGLIDDLQLEEVLQEHSRSGKPVSEILSDFGLVEVDTQLEITAQHLGTEVVDVGEVNYTPELLKLIPPATARMYQCLPVADYGSTLRVAVGDPLNPHATDELSYIIGKEIQIVVANRAAIEKLITRYYGEDTESVGDILKELGEDAEIAREAAEAAATNDAGEAADLANEVPIVRFVNLVLFQAVQDRASDIHFEPFESEFKIRYRVDGALYEMSPPPKHLALPVISRIKVMSNLNIAERRLPQDGRIQMNLAGKQVDLRVSTLPTQFGESVVLRVLDRTVVNLELESLGMPADIYEQTKETIKVPNGIFIVTGPTGSGKTTTLYSCLKRINTVDIKLLTA